MRKAEAVEKSMLDNHWCVMILSVQDMECDFRGKERSVFPNPSRRRTSLPRRTEDHDSNGVLCGISSLAQSPVSCTVGGQYYPPTSVSSVKMF